MRTRFEPSPIPRYQLSSEVDGQKLRRSMGQKIATEIKDAILTGRTPAGTKLNQLKLAEQFQVSTTPIREALRVLEAQGLVQIDSYTGASVLRPTLDDMTSLYNIRLALCPLVAEGAFDRITQQQLNRAEEANERLVAVDEGSDWLEANRVFHAALDETIGDLRLATLWKELGIVSTIYVNMSLPFREAAQQGAYSEHVSLLEAYASADVARVSSLLAEHLTNTFNGCKMAMMNLQQHESEAVALP